VDAERATTDAVADDAMTVAAVDSGVRPPVTNLLENSVEHVDEVVPVALDTGPR